MQILVHLKEEIGFTAINGHRQVAIFYLIQFDHRMLIPNLFVGGKLPQLFSFPSSAETVGYPPLHSYHRTEYFFMSHGNPQSSMPSMQLNGRWHILSSRNGGIVLVGIFHQL